MNTLITVPLPMTPVVSGKYRDPIRLMELQTEFKEHGFVKLPSFFVDSIFNIVVRNLEALHERRIRRDFIMPKFQTERKMSIVGGSVLTYECLPLVALYGNVELRNIISRIIGRRVHTVRHEEEFMVANFLDGPDDTHGWHTDDPQYALVAITEAPIDVSGGEVEYIFRWRKICADFGLEANSETNDAVVIARDANLVKSVRLVAGDCYLLNANEALHRVAPLIGCGQRKALNMAFDDRVYRKFGDTANILYGN